MSENSGKGKHFNLLVLSVTYVKFPNMQHDIIAAGREPNLAKEKVQSDLVELLGFYFEVTKASNI